MAVVRVCRFDDASESVDLEGVDVGQSIRDFKNTIADKIGKVADEIAVVYCGLRLDSEQSLLVSGIKSNATVYILDLEPSSKDNESIMDPSVELTILSALKSVLLKPANKDIIHEILRNTETLESIMDASPGLENDPIALSLLRDPVLLSTICKKENLKKVLNDHPSFGHACLYLASEVKAAGVLASQDSQPSYAGSYSLDDYDETMPPEENPTARVSSQQREDASQITTSQLMNAIASAQSASPSTATTNTPTSSGGRGVVTSALLQNAMQQAQSTMITPSPPQEDTSQNLQSQLEYLRDMGITDEAVARHALEATNGDITAAVELIFGGHVDD